MMDSSKARERIQLGMSYGKARHILWTQLLFAAAQKLGQDSCFRCNEKIETVETFSVDHKRAWLDVSPNLFWDADNIAFSHRVCNTKASRRNPGNTREGIRRYWATVNKAPRGTSWCFGCKDFVDKEAFNLNTRRLSGVQKYCKGCRTKGVGRGKQWPSMPTADTLRSLLENNNYRAVGKKLGVSHMTVVAWSKELGLQHVRQNAGIAHLVEHSPCKREAAGS